MEKICKNINIIKGVYKWENGISKKNINEIKLKINYREKKLISEKNKYTEQKLFNNNDNSKFEKYKFKINTNFKNQILFLIIGIFFSIISLTNEISSKIRKLNKYSSEITLTINATGIQDIIYRDFANKLGEVIVNDNPISPPSKSVIITEREQNNIVIMRFNSTIDSCYNMFRSLKNVTKIDLSNFDASHVTDMKFMFYDCSNLKYINFTNINTSSVIYFGNIFYGCANLTSLDLSDLDTSSAEDMSCFFQKCQSLTSLDLSSFDISKVTSLISFFNECINLEYINLSSFRTPLLKSTNNMFNKCLKLTSIDLSNFNTSNVETMNQMFCNCNSLTTINLSNFVTYNVREIERLFESCNNLISIDLSNFNTSKVTTMRHMFSYCNKLEYINIDNFDTSNVKDMQYMFNECKQLTTLDLSSFNTSLVADMRCMFNECEKLKRLNLSNFDGAGVTLTWNMFKGCKDLTSLDLSNFKACKATNMQFMFSDCENLLSLNLSNFETLKATNMKNMFSNCKKLKTLDISNFVTSSVTYLNDMFSNCEELVSLDLSSFNLTYASLNLDNMFNNCKSLVFLNLESFEIGNSMSITNIFNGTSDSFKFCLNETKTQSLVTILQKSQECFNLCFKENIKVIVENKECITSCRDNNEFQYEYNNICYNTCPENTHISSIDPFLCETDLDCKVYSNEKKSECYDEIEDGFYLKDPTNKILDRCHSDCKTCEKKENDKSTNCKTCPEGKFLNLGNCIDSCEKNYFTDSLGNNICMCPLEKCKECSKESYDLELCISCNNNYYPKLNEDKKNGFINCHNNPEGYYFDLEQKIYKPCYQNCKTCIKEGTFENNNCEICAENYEFKSDSPNNNNCYQICQYYYYSDDSNNYKCTTEDKCPDNKKMISEKRKCIDECKNDDIYQNEYNNKCYKDCPQNTIPNNYLCINIEVPFTNINNEITNITMNNKPPEITTQKKNDSSFDCSAEEFFIQKSCGKEVSNPTNKDKLIENIRDDIENHRIDGLIDNITKTKKDVFVHENDTIYQITTTENQNSNEYKNMSSVKLGDCEDRLKEVYQINKNLSLIIFKIDYYSPGLKIPIIGYEIFHPLNKTKLDLNHCKDILIELNIPVSIDEENLFKYDPNSEYYTDECVPSKSENGTDIILNDRQNEFNENNLSLCQNNCTFTGYEKNTQKALCDCEVRTKITLISEIMDDKNKLSNNFTAVESSSTNIITMKCVMTLFTKEGLKSNIGSYILIFSTVFYAISSIIFYKVGYALLEADISAIMFEKSKIKQGQDNKMSIYQCNQKPIKRKKKHKKTKTEQKSSKSNLKFNYPPKKKNSNTLKNVNTSKTNETFSQSKLKLKDVKILLNFQKRKSKKIKTSKNSMNHNILDEEKPKSLNIINNNNNLCIIENFNDYELNSFSYSEALQYDKRTFSQYYVSLLRTKQPILFSFVPNKDYNATIIKICLFLLSFCIYYAVNALFFNENTIHKIYEDGGSYNLGYSLPKVLFSFIIAHFLSTIIKYAFLSERNILEIKKEKILENAKEKVEKEKRNIVIKYIIFFVAGILFLIFFWYYLSSFGAVYQNTQVYLIKNTLLSSLIGLIYPFFINIIPGFLRIMSLGNNNKEVLYKISKFIQLI